MPLSMLLLFDGIVIFRLVAGFGRAIGGLMLLLAYELSSEESEESKEVSCIEELCCVVSPKVKP